MKTIWHVHYQSRHFYFEAFGGNAAEAHTAFNNLIDDHAAQYSLSPEFKHEAMNDREIGEYALGVGYRDGSPL